MKDVSMRSIIIDTEVKALSNSLTQEQYLLPGKVKKSAILRFGYLKFRSYLKF